MKVKVVLLSICSIILLASCAGIGVPDSSDPYKKLQYSYQAMDMKRYIPANKLIVGAIEIFKERNDKTGLAEAYATYGNYHKYGFFNKKPLTKAPDPKESVKYFKLAAKLFKETGDTNSVAKSYMGMGSALLDTDTKKGCEYYLKAIDTYDSKGKKIGINPSFKTFPEMVKYFHDKNCK